MNNFFPRIKTPGMSRNGHLEAENKRLSVKVEEMKEICTLTSTLNIKYKSQLDREQQDKESLKESNHKLKLKLNNLSVKCNEMNERVRVLETNLKRKVLTRVNQPKVQIIKSISEITRTDNKSLEKLQKRYDELDAEHQEALQVIDELEFELGDVITSSFHRLDDNFSFPFYVSPRLQIDYLEMETLRLQQENEKLQELLQQAGST